MLWVLYLVKFSITIVDAKSAIVDCAWGEAYVKLDGDDWVWLADGSRVPPKVASAIEQTLKGTRS